MVRLTLVLPLSALLLFPLYAQQNSTSPKQVTVQPYTAIPQADAQKANPVKSTPESLARAKKWWNMDCAMCHGKNGDGKGDIGAEMKIKPADFTSPATLKERSDGEIFWIIKNGHQDMPPEGQRIKPEEDWDLVNYVRSLAKAKADDAKP